MISTDNHIAVIGAGPAGLMAAEVANAAGLQVDLFEAKGSVGRKFLIAGKGGLNLTHGEPRPARVQVLDGGVARVRFDEPSRRVAPGQSVVLYAADPVAGEVVVGGGLAV